MPSISEICPKLFVPACLFAALLFAPSTARLEDAGSGPAEVHIRDLAFAPDRLVVKAGTEVRFTNADRILHSIIADGGQFNSDALDQDESFAISIKTPGDYSYHCGIHPQMRGQITILP